MTASGTIRLYGTASDSIVDGPGLRYVVFVQGCSHACPGCHNPQSQPMQGGTVRVISDVVADIQANKLVHDVTLSGGEPFEQAAAAAELARRLKAIGYGIWTYTGYRYEDLVSAATQTDAEDDKNVEYKEDKHVASTPARSASFLDPVAVRALLDVTDVLVDGPYIARLRSLKLAWRGSSNQRLIDIPASRATGAVVLWEAYEDFPVKPPSW